jgi:hypothetical protein
MWDDLEPTADPTVRIEWKEPGYVVYRNIEGRRWSVRGECDRRGDCLIGAIIDTPKGSVIVRSKRHIRELKRELGRERIDSEMDVPVTPEFKECCGADRFHYVELPRKAD